MQFRMMEPKEKPLFKSDLIPIPPSLRPSIPPIPIHIHTHHHTDHTHSQ
jgi:hypothetical protein